MGRSALDAVELMHVGIQFLREHMPPNSSIHYSITDAGSVSPNVVQPAATTVLMVRGETVRKAKALLFSISKKGVINLDDAAAEKMLADAKCPCMTFSCGKPEADLESPDMLDSHPYSAS